jgi:hypothetical protein
MSTLSTIRLAVKQYLQVNFPVAVQPPIGGAQLAGVSDAVADSLILLAINNARKFAEMKHDWRLCEVRVRATVPAGSRVAMTELVDYWDDQVEHNLRALSNAYLENTETGVLHPIEIQTAKSLASRVKDVDDAQTMYDAQLRYPGDLPDEEYISRSTLVVHGDYMYFQRKLTSESNIVIDGYRWLPDYESDEDTDFFVTKGTGYLLWASMVEANHLFKSFVQRQEGNIAPPVKERDDALQVLIDNDSYAIMSAVDHDLS